MRLGPVFASLRQVAAIDRTQLGFGAAARLLPAFAMVLAVGLFAADRTGAAIAAGGAFVVGFGTYQTFTRSHLAPMLLAAAGMSISTFVGTLAGANPVTMALAAVVYGFVCGLMPAVGMGAFWIAQQCTVFLLIAGAYAGGIGAALARTALVFGGGATQIACYAAMVFLLDGTIRAPGLAAITADAGRALAGLRFQLRRDAPLFRFALRFTIVLAAAVVTERLLALPNGYWVAMTALLLMRPDFQDTLVRSIGRVVGTLAGAAAATVASGAMAPGAGVLAALVAAFAFLAYATLRLNYGVFSFFVTGYVIFLLVLAGLAEPQVAGMRIVATLIGGGFAVAAHAEFYRLRCRARAARGPTPPSGTP
jgi:Fusaric acid resistance protein-like